MTAMMASIAISTSVLWIGGCMGSDDVLNHPPTMESVQLYGNEDVEIAFEVVAFDEDRDNLELGSFSSSRGDLTIKYVSHHLLPDATRLKVALVFDPVPGYNGDAAISLRVSDGTDSIDASYPIVIAPINDRPTAMRDAVAASANTPAVIFPSTLLANDFDPDQSDRDYVRSLAVTGVAKSQNGAAILGADTITFTPDTNFSGIATFEYTLSDGKLTDTAIVAIAVGLPNAVPIAVDDSLELDPSISNVFVFDPHQMTRNDIDDDGQNLTVIAVANATHGSVEVNAGVVTFTLGPDFDGTASFDYTATDGVATDTAQVTLFVPIPI